MTSAPAALTGIEMDESEYLCTLSNSNRFEFTNGVVTAKRGPYMTQKAHVTAANVLTLAFLLQSRADGGFGGQTPTTNISAAADRLYRIPDLAYWAAGRPVGSSIFLPPTLGVEIVSPDQSVPELREKCRLYLQHGVDVCWLVNPDARWAEVFEDGHDGERVPDEGSLPTSHIPGLVVRLSDLWEAIDAAPA